MGKRYDIFDDLLFYDCVNTTNASGAILNAGSNGRIYTDWIPVNSSTLTFQKTTTASGTLYARFSSGINRPDQTYQNALYTPAFVPQIVYHPSGTLSSQGWAGIIPSVGTYDSTMQMRNIAGDGYINVTKDGAGLITSIAPKKFSFRIRFATTNANNSGLALDFGPPGTNVLFRNNWLGAAYPGLNGSFNTSYGGGSTAGISQASVGYYWDWHFEIIYIGGIGDGYRAWFRKAGAIGSAPDYDFYSSDGFTFAGVVKPNDYSPNTYSIQFAYDTTHTDLWLGELAIWVDDTNGSTQITDGGTINVPATAKWAQVYGEQENGNISTIGIYDGVALSAPVSVFAEATASGKISCSTELVSDATKYRWRVKLNGVLISTNYTTTPFFDAYGLSNGSYTVECELLNNTGRLSSTTSSVTVALPYVEPMAHVYIDISPDHVGPGEEAVLSYDVGGNVSATIGGGGITGTGSQVIVTGDPIPVGTTPPDQPTFVTKVTTPDRPSYISYI